MNFSAFRKKQTFVFYALAGLMLLPLFFLKYVVTHDGAAHVYNAGLIRLLLGGSSLMNEFLRIKTYPEPNWIGHAALLVLSSIFSPGTADKIFLGLYIVFFPVCFRQLILKVNAESSAVSFLIFPFVYSLFFFLGVYNFLASVVFLLWSLSSTLPALDSGNAWWKIFAFSILLYFSHLLVLGVYIMITGISLMFILFSGPTTRADGGKLILQSVTALLPVLFLTAIFFMQKLSFEGKAAAVTFAEMIDFLWSIRFLITLTYSPENIFAIVLQVLIIFLLAAAIVSAKRQAASEKKYYERSLFWIITAAAMLLCYLMIPDEAASGGVVKFRFLMLFYIFILVLISTYPFKRAFTIPVIIFISTWIIGKLSYLYPMMKTLSQEANELVYATKDIPPNSLLLPLNYSGNWLHDNLCNYAGFGREILVLDNYEANTPHFPLEWKENRSPIKILGEFTGYVPLCADIRKFEYVTAHRVDYVLVWRPQKMDDSCSLALHDFLYKNYSAVIAQEGLQLFRRNER